MGRLLWSGQRKWTVGLALLLALALSTAAWIERGRLRIWYNVYRLVRADGDERARWVERVAGLGPSALPLLLDRLAQEDVRTCENAQAALAALAEHGQPNDPTRIALANRLVHLFPKFSACGQQKALELQRILLRPTPDGRASEADVDAAAAGLLAKAVREVDPGVRKETLALAETLIKRATGPEILESCREVTRAGLRDEEPENRVRAIQLASSPKINLLDEVPLLLRDRQPDVRRAALLAVGSAPEVISTDDLLYLLHDDDARIHQLCEQALRGRGLRDEHIKLGRLMTARDAKTRLEVLDCLQHTREVEPTVWLRRLSHDPAEAVRAAAVRAAGEMRVVHLTDRLEQIAQDDPSDTVRQLAQYYLNCPKPEAH